MTERKAGWYWVKSRRFSGSWEVAELDGDKLWYFCGCGEPQSYSFVTEIGPRIPTPDEHQ